MPKVFISYSHKDEEWENRLQAQLAVLENQGLLSVWEDRKIAGGDDWYPAIEQAIESAHIAILLISANFLSSKFILGKEVPPLLERRKKEGLRVIPLILKPCPWQTVEWLSKIQGRPLDNKPLSGFDEHNRDHHLSELALEINTLLNNISPATQPDVPDAASSSSPKATYDPCNAAFLVPFRAKGKYMVGRDKALEKVRQQLLAGKPTSIGQTALFQGIGGLGKTQLAVEYAYQYRDEYPNGVYWITADENIDAQLTQIAVDAHWVAPASEHATKLDIARHRLKTYSDCLIVFDNLESVDAIRDYLPEPSANPHILVTSRREQPEFTDVKLELLDDDESYLMLVQEAERVPANEEEKFSAREIATVLSGLPLALELAGAYLAHRPIGWCTYRDLLHEDLKQALPTQLASLTKHEADLFKTLRVSEREISVEPLLDEVLDMLTWSGSSPMSLRLMAYLLDVQPTRLYGALGLGEALRLLQKVPDSERYAIHRLVQEVRRQDRPLAQRNDWANTIAQRLGDWFEEIRRDFRELPAFELEFEHLRAWQVHTELSSPSTSARLLWLQAYPNYYRGRYGEALLIVQQALVAYEAQDIGHTLLQANLLHDLANCSMHLGNYPRTLELGQQALGIQRELLGDKHLDVALSLNNLADCYTNLGNYHHALALIQQALGIQRELLNDKHRSIAASLSILARCHAKFGDYHCALELDQQALEMRRELFGDKHPDVANSISSLALRHTELGNHHRALELDLQALEMWRELFGDKYPSIAYALNNLAFTYEKLGDHSRALELGKQALEMRRELLGESHPDTINSLQFVAKRLYKNPFTATQGKALVEEFLKHISREHPSRAKVLEFLNSRDGFRKQGKIGHSKKPKKKR